MGLHLRKDLIGASRSSFCEARQKLGWKAFEYLLDESQLPDSELGSEVQWRGHRVHSIDGTKVTLPHSKEILESFPQRKTSMGPEGSVSHYPFAVMVTSCNVFTGQPRGAHVMNMHGSEREAAIKLSADFKAGDIFLLDRGLDGVRVWDVLAAQGQFYVNRLRVVGGQGPKSQNYAGNFLNRGQSEEVIERPLRDPITNEWRIHKLRLIRGRKLKDGSTLVIGTNLLDRAQYPASELLALYLRRWKIETMYGWVKSQLELQKFHARTTNGVLQEIFANLLLVSMTVALNFRAARIGKIDPEKAAPNFKNTTEVIKRNLFICTGSIRLSGRKMKQHAQFIVQQVLQVLCKKQPDRSYPRYSRQAVNRWAFGKADKIRASSEGRRTNENIDIRTKRRA